MPHVPRPMMNTSPQMTSVEETIRMPDWRSASPKKRSTRRPHTSRTTLPVNPAISPVEASHSRGIASSSFIVPLPARAHAGRRPSRNGHHLITRMFGCVASSVCVNTVLNAPNPRNEITTAWLTALPTPSAPPEAVMPL